MLFNTGNRAAFTRRSDARRYPAIDPLDSWSKYPSIVDEDKVSKARKVLRDGSEVGQMMKVVGEEGTSIDDFVLYLKSEYIDATYLQQNAFSEMDAANSVERQEYVFNKLLKIMDTKMKFDDQNLARSFFHQLTQTARDWNNSEFQSDEFKQIEEQMNKMLAEVSDYAD
jgi:V/A-type H+-transporting ATPase subunit A